MSLSEEKQDEHDRDSDRDETRDTPVMDGATEHFDPDADPRKGEDDSGLIRDVESGRRTTNPHG